MLVVDSIYLGDCLDVLKYVNDKSVDMVLCDLPYGTTRCSWDSIIPLDKLWVQYRRIIKDRGAIVLTAMQPFTSVLVCSNLEMYKHCWVWVKTKCSGHLNSSCKPLCKHEDIVVFGNIKGINYYPQGLIKGSYKTGRTVNMEGKVYNQFKNHGVSLVGNYPKSALNFANPSGKGHLHPTQKPVELFEYLIKTYTCEGDLVVDNCAGSGTTGIACRRLNRRCILIEKEKKYYDIAVGRLIRDE